MSNNNGVLTECVSNLSDDDVKFLHPRLAQRLSGDLAEVLLHVEKVSAIDKVFSSSESADQLYNAIDALAKEVEKEFRRRPHLMVEDRPKKKRPYKPKPRKSVAK
jgi:ribosome-associated translation inhibitor RaiA